MDCGNIGVPAPANDSLKRRLQTQAQWRVSREMVAKSIAMAFAGRVATPDLKIPSEII
jgi:hypothetical protein